MNGVRTVFVKEMLRFWKVSLQTLAAPILTSLLYLLIFSHAIASHVTVFGGVPYTSFLIPGLAMMTLLQNAFANSASSLIQSKVTGNIVFMLLAPLRSVEIYAGYCAASVVRGVVVGAGLIAATAPFVGLPFAHPLWIAAFAVLGAAMLGSLGIVAGMWSEKFDHMASFQNFIVVPATFLSGVFYSVASLPPFWREVSAANPFFYLVDGVRYGFLGASDVSPWISFGAALAGNAACGLLAWAWLERGHKIRN